MKNLPILSSDVKRNLGKYSQDRIKELIADHQKHLAKYKSEMEAALKRFDSSSEYNGTWMSVDFICGKIKHHIGQVVELENAIIQKRRDAIQAELDELEIDAY